MTNVSFLMIQKEVYSIGYTLLGFVFGRVVNV